MTDQSWTPTTEQVQALADAMWQLLDDMAVSGLSVCGVAKAEARLAYEPWFQATGMPDEKNDDGKSTYADWMSIAEAEAVLEGLS